MRVNTLAYRYGNAFSLENKNSGIILGLQSAIQTIVVHETKELDDKRRTYENVFQIAQKEDNAYRARLPNSLATRDGLYFGPQQQEDEEEALMLYGKKGPLDTGHTKKSVAAHKDPFLYP